jgi:hypothetical protein
MIPNMSLVRVGLPMLVNRAEERLGEVCNQQVQRGALPLSSMVLWSDFSSDSG